ncbi:hypothetical protein ACFWC5_38515 [Streptomyces sp. NPDC060085]|uniref:hypothetical protein n=1 Tax=Streptomyces sp. NPDC060085 TaxID=3347054 RepID=UPI00365F94A9
MREGKAPGAAEQPIPRDRPDQQADDNDPLDIETMLGHAQRREEEARIAHTVTGRRSLGGVISMNTAGWPWQPPAKRPRPQHAKAQLPVTTNSISR